MILILVGCFFLLLLLGAVLVKVQLRKKEMKKYYIAAQRIIQEECLDYAIQNPYFGGKQPATQKLMICLKVEKSKLKGFVFDPSHKIHIGRDSEKNEICLPDVTVSGSHCCIFLYQNQVWLEDLQSSNGTYVKRGFGASYFLQGNQMELFTGDRIQVGKTVFRLELFFCDLLSA